MSTVTQNLAGNSTAVSVTSESNGNKKSGSIVITTSDGNENKMTTNQHHNDEGECE